MDEPVLEGYQLSPQQKRIWRLQENGACDLLWLRGAMLIDGRLDAARFQDAVARVTERYEILRTAFKTVTGLAFPVQVINASTKPVVDEVRIRGAEPADLKNSSPAPSFNLATGQTVRWTLANVSEDRHVLMLDMSALCADARSIELLLAEVCKTYQTETRNGTETQETPIQYADIAEWENQLLDTDDARSVFSYWQKLDLDTATGLTLPREAAAPAGTHFNPRSVAVNVAGALTQEIARIAEQYRVSAQVFLLSCWSVLIRRVTGASETVIGAYCDGRSYGDLHDAIGPLARYVPVSCGLDHEVSFHETLSAISTALRDAAERQEYFAWDRVSSPGTGGAPRFFPATFAFGKFETAGCMDRFKLELRCIEDGGGGLVTEFRYDSNVCAKEDIERLAKNFHRLLESAVANPQAPVSDLEIVSDSERQRLIFEFNNTRAAVDQPSTVQEWIRHRAALDPGGPAVVYGDRKLTYAELDAKANQLAHHLRRKGVVAETPVAICLDRSPEMIIAVLGILKAGGAYVPLSPTYPKDRLKFTLEDSGAPIVVTMDRMSGVLGQDGISRVRLDTDGDIIGRESTADPEPVTTSDNLAYIIYTSGSTGKPKGVEVSQRNLIHSTLARTLSYPDAVERFLLVSPLAFDSSVAGLFWTLCQGGTLVLPSDGAEQDPSQLARIVESQRITHMLTLPSVYSRILSEARPEQLKSLRVVVVAGEACTPEVVERHFQSVPDAGLFNEYGPTEGTVWSTVFKCSSTDSRHVSIGKAIPNVQAYILDPRRRPVPIGVAGELYIGGSGIARGYRNRSDLTEQRFVPDTFSGRTGDRLYRTGDLARFLPDGNIEFLGRLDHQVKIRGYRIELEEIESALARLPVVGQAAVVARKDDAEERIVAYVVPKRGHLPTTTDLRDLLSRDLPDYMIPSAFVILDSLPLTPNGKVDRQALPEPERVRPQLRQAFVAPRNAVEQLLAEIWGEALQVERVGVEDNFLELGGHSILATRLVSQIREVLQIDLPLRSLFENPTVGQLSEAILSDVARRPRLERIAQTALQVAHADEKEIEAMMDALSARSGGTSHD